MQKLVATLVIALATAIALAACGSSSSSSSSPSGSGGGGGGGTSSTQSTAAGGGGGAAQTVKVSADPSGALRYQQSTLSAKAGNVTFNFQNSGPVAHNFCLETSSGSQIGCSGTTSNGGTQSLSETLKPGTYTYYCNVDSHRQAGMVGKLTVK